MERQRREVEVEVEIAQLVAGVSRRTGLDFAGCHRDRMVGAVLDMSSEAGAPGVADYLALLDDDQVAYEALVDRLTIGETYFFRDPAQLEVIRGLLRDGATPGSAAGRPQLWSAGCATGEEPYTFAMILAEEGALDGSSIVGTDLSERALEQARDATYGRWSLRRCDERQRAVHFAAVGGRFRPRRRYLDAVALRPLSLLARPPGEARFDIVCCRNVLMYLTAEAREVALGNLRNALVPGGWLFLGPSDPVVELDGLACRATGAGIAYERGGRKVGQRSGPLVASPEPALQPRSDGAPAEPAAGTPQLPALDRPAPHVADDDRGPDAGDDVAATIWALAAGGDDEAASRLLEAAIAVDPVDAELRYLAAMLHLGAGRRDEAVRSGVAAVYLDPGLAVAHLVLGQAQQLSGNDRLSRRSYLNAFALLSAMPPDAAVRHGAGEPAGRLAATAAALAGG